MDQILLMVQIYNALDIFSVITILIYLNFTIINVEYIGFILPLNIFLVCFIFLIFLINLALGMVDHIYPSY